MAKAQTTTKTKSTAKAAPEAAEKAAEMSSDAIMTMNEAVTSSLSLMRVLGERNIGLMSRTFEQGIETRDAMMELKDVREVVELQSTFAKSIFSAYTQEFNTQAALVTGAFRDTVEPFKKQMTASFEMFQPAQ